MMIYNGNFWVALSAVILGTGLANKGPVERQAPKEWRKGYSGHGTTHEQMGTRHWNLAEFTQYVSVMNYSQAPQVNTGYMGPAYNIGRAVLDDLFTNDPPIPKGYVQVINGSTLILGPKVEQDDWMEFLKKNFALTMWVALLLLIIIITPFLGVCYCCFCCCLRCKQGCPPCDQKRDALRRLFCGVCLVLFILPVILALAVIFFSNRTLDIGLADTKETIRMGSKDTCAFLKDVADHIYHLFVYNYQEMESHMHNHLKNAHLHIFMDLSDTSEANSIEELERIMNNMPEALKLMRQVHKLEQEIRFLSSQLRDGLRGVKMTTNKAVSVHCRTAECVEFMVKNDIQFMDSSNCLHLEGLPDSSIYVDAMQKIINSDMLPSSERALSRLRELQLKIKTGLERTTPPIYRDLALGKALFENQAKYVVNATGAVISEVHLATLRSTRSFDDVYERFDQTRSMVNVVICVMIVAIILLLIMALICGCFGKASTGFGDGFCSKVTGAWCLVVAIILIFSVLSFIFLVALFYFMIGAVIYEGACTPNSTIFGSADSTIDLNMILPHNDESSMPQFKLESALDACRGNQTIFNYLKIKEIYDVDDLIRAGVISSDSSLQPVVVNEDLSDVRLLDNDELSYMTKMRNDKLNTYHSILYTKVLCNKYTPIDMNTLGDKYTALANSLYEYASSSAIVMLKNQNIHLNAYKEHFHDKLQTAYSQIIKLLGQIDDLILYENHDFGTTMHILLGAITNSQNFIRTNGVAFINMLAKNLSEVVDEQTHLYIEYLINQSNEEVGHCKPLSYIYDRSINMICRRLADPINGYWVGLVFCGFLLIPILIIAHLLMCLYKKIMIVTFVPVAGYECPICINDDRISGAGITFFEDRRRLVSTDIDSAQSSLIAVTTLEGGKYKDD